MKANGMPYQKWLGRNACPLAGKLAVVTGANSGIGYAAATHYLHLGADVILACRNRERGEAALNALQAQFPERGLQLLLLDLADDGSIDTFSQTVCASTQKVDILLHCAGVYYPRQSRTASGLPMTVGVNYVGTARLTEALLPHLAPNARVIFTTSLVDRFGKLRKTPDKGNEGYAAYAESKLLLSAYACKKAKERGENSPHFIAVHPGIAATSLLDPGKTSHNPLFSKLGHAFLFLFTHPKEKAALTAVLAACKGENGSCIGPRGLFGISGYPHFTSFCRNVRRRAKAEGDPYRNASL